VNIIKKYRLLAGMTQDELARKIRANNAAVVCWESDKRIPTPKYVKKLMDALHIPADEMLDWLEAME